MSEASQDDVAAQIAQLEAAARPAMTGEAFARYNTLKIAHPQRAVQSLMVVVQFAQKNNAQVDDEQYKRLLRMMQGNREMRIKHGKY